MADSLLEGDQPSAEDRNAIIAKWKDKPREELEAAKAESDLYIKTLTARLDDLKKDYLSLREQHQASTDLKTLLDQMKKDRVSPDTSHVTPENAIQTAIKPEDIESLVQRQVSEKLTEHQTVLKQQENFRNVQAKLKEAFGEDYQSAYKSRLDNLGITKEYADDLAKNHPTVFIKTFELEGKPVNIPTLPRNSQRTTQFAPQTPKRDWSYYQEMKKSNPKMYLDPKIAIQMHDDAIALGAAFGMPED